MTTPVEVTCLKRNLESIRRAPYGFITPAHRTRYLTKLGDVARRHCRDDLAGEAAALMDIGDTLMWEEDTFPRIQPMDTGQESSRW